MLIAFNIIYEQGTYYLFKILILFFRKIAWKKLPFYQNYVLLEYKPQGKLTG